MLLRKTERMKGLKLKRTFSILGLQEPPTTKNGLPFGLDKRVLKECIKQDGHGGYCLHEYRILLYRKAGLPYLQRVEIKTDDKHWHKL